MLIETYMSEVLVTRPTSGCSPEVGSWTSRCPSGRSPAHEPYGQAQPSPRAVPPGAGATHRRLAADGRLCPLGVCRRVWLLFALVAPVFP